MLAKQEYKDILNQIGNLVPESIQRDYEKEIEKASPIFEFLDYVRDNGVSYIDRLFDLLTGNDADILEFLEGVRDLYYRNQSAVFSNFLLPLYERVDNTTD